MISLLEAYKDANGDLPVLMREANECYEYPYLEVNTIRPVLNEVVCHEDSDDEEILNFIALDFE